MSGFVSKHPWLTFFIATSILFTLRFVVLRLTATPDASPPLKA